MTRVLILLYVILQLTALGQVMDSSLPVPIISSVDSVAINMKIKKELIEERAQLIDSIERFKNELRIAKAIQDGKPYQVSHDIGKEYWIFLYRIVRLDTTSSKMDTIYVGVKRKKKNSNEY